MSYLQAVILGLIQGLTEFLPVSSSGHLALLQHFFGISGDDVLLFTVLLHVGTLISVFFMYWKDIWELIKELFMTIGDIFTGKGLRLDERPIRKLGVLIITASIPTAIIGFAFNDFFEGLYSNILFIGIGFMITGTMLFLSERFGSNSRDLDKMNLRNAIFIGILQGIAIYPGISRSGSTIVGGLTTGLKRELAVRFAFLISVPAIMGSALLEGKHALEEGIDMSVLGPVIVGMAVAAVSGVIAIKAMIKVVSDRKLKYFSFYVWVLGTAVIIYSIFGMAVK
ncbi:MAG: undecaprenyl-diphosphate phosphatase [Eubacterium sp.]|nr:undecaprenyl-diphosphate phosphatase [Eubacterium sp.]